MIKLARNLDLVTVGVVAAVLLFGLFLAIRHNLA
jgi:hypothetical protein